MSNSPKLIYNSSKLYKSDINDLVEEEMNKGGPGSGIKGHRTPAESMRHDRMKEDGKLGRLDKLRGHSQYWHSRYKDAKAAGNKENVEHYRKLMNEADEHLLRRLGRTGENAKYTPGKKITDGMHYSERKKYEEKK